MRRLSTHLLTTCSLPLHSTDCCAAHTAPSLTKLSTDRWWHPFCLIDTRFNTMTCQLVRAKQECRYNVMLAVEWEAAPQASLATSGKETAVPPD